MSISFNTPTQNNVKQFQKVVEGFKSLGFNDDELDSIYRILAGVVNLGDVDFYQTVDKDNMEQATVNNVDQVIVGMISFFQYHSTHLFQINKDNFYHGIILVCSQSGSELKK